MERSWWWKAALYGAVTVLACLYLVPTLVPRRSSRRSSRSCFHKRIQQGLDLAGGLRLVYDGQHRQGGLRPGRSDRQRDRGQPAQEGHGVTVIREGRDEIVFTFKNPADTAKLDNEVLAEYRDDARRGRRATSAKGMVRLRLDPDQVVEIAGLRAAPGHRDHPRPGRQVRRRPSRPSSRRAPTSSSSCPASKSADFERIKSIIGRTAQLAVQDRRRRARST